MGASGIYTTRSFEQVFKEELGCLNPIKYAEVKEHDPSYAESATFYAAVPTTVNDFVIALIVSFNRIIDESGSQVIYKVFDETSGPFFYDCPKDIFDLLSPLDEMEKCGVYIGYAKKWRAKVNV